MSSDLQINLSKKFPSVGLQTVASPLHKLQHVSVAHEVDLWVKRDDVGDFALAGCKARKLDLILYRVLEQVGPQPRRIVTCGMSASNSCRTLAAASARLGLECHLFLKGESRANLTGNDALAKALGATIHWMGDDISVPQLLATGKQWSLENDAYYVKTGGTEPLGVIGMALGYLEMMSQARTQSYEPAHIVHASASGGVSAGLRLGASLLAEATGATAPEIHSIAVIDSIYEDTRAEYEKITRDAASMLGKSIAAPLRLNLNYLGRDYYATSEEAIVVCQEFARLEGIILDGCYVSRAAVAALEIAKASGAPVLLWHTGGNQSLLDPVVANRVWDKRV